MEQVTFEFTAAKHGHFVCHAADGSEIRVEAGKNLTTGDPQVIAALDQASHAVKRVKPGKED